MYEIYQTHEVAFKLPIEIVNLEHHAAGSRLFISGKSSCDLLVYVPSRSGPKRPYEVGPVLKRVTHTPVRALRAIEETEQLLLLTDKVLSLHSLSPPCPMKEVVPCKTFISVFAVHIDEKLKKVHVVVVSKRKFTIYRKDDTFVEASSDLPLAADNPSHLKWCGSSICYALRDSYHIQRLRQSDDGLSWTGENRRLFTVGEVPCIIDALDRGLAGFARGEVMAMIPTRGDEERSKSPSNPVTQLRHDVKFTEHIIAAAYDSPYVIALLPRGRVEVRSITPPCILIQSISALNKAVHISIGGPGQIFVASTSDIWQLEAYSNLRKNISVMMQEKQFDLAIQLTVTMMKDFPEEQKVEIKRQAAINFFNQRKFEEAFALHTEIKSSVIEVLQLFPEFLPAKFRSQAESSFDFAENEKKRAMLALGSYLAAVRTELAQDLLLYQRSQQSRSSSPTPLTKEREDLRITTPKQAELAKNQLQVVDTTLLQCYLKTKPMLVDSLLRLSNNACSFDDAEAMLKKDGQTKSLFVLYETRKRHRLALDLLRSESSRMPPDHFFDGIDRTVEYLQTLGNSHLDLIFEHAKWVLQKNAKEGIVIFTGDENELAKNLNRDAVLKFLLRECVEAVIPYLEHVIYEWEDKTPQLHETLADQYVRMVKKLLSDYVHIFNDEENMIRAGHEEGELGVFRQKLLRFLESSLSYSPNTILVQLNHYAFSEERALILGRLKKHNEALAIFTGILHDVDAAERYCARHYNPVNEEDSQVYLLLVRALVSPSSDPEGAAGFLDSGLKLPPPSPNVPMAIRVLGKHADKMDAIAALELIPDDAPLCNLSAALCALVQAAADQATSTRIRRAISESARIKTARNLREVNKRRVRLSENSQCTYCKKKIGTSAFVRFPLNGELHHVYCFEKQYPKTIADR